MKKFSLIIGVSILFVSCSKMLFTPTNGIKNTYMLREKQAPENNFYAVDPIMRISRVEPAGDSIRLYTHILDTDDSFLSGAAGLNYRSRWCTLLVNNNPVNDYTVREVYEDKNVPTVYALVLDHSGSMSTKVTKMQEAVRAFINKKHPQDAICIVKYDSRAGLEVPINTNASQLQTEFRSDGLGLYGGTTAILNGIMLGMETIKPSAYRRKVVISFTDGADNSSTVTKEYVTWYAQQNNINLCTIDFNNSPYNDFMPELANTTGGTYTYFNNTNDFNYVFDDVVNKMNHSYVVTYKNQTQGQQSVVLRYCAEPNALEANADFNTVRSPLQPIRDVPRPVVDQSSAQADKPIYTRPVSSYPTNYTGPLKGSSTPGTIPPRTGTNGNNGGSNVGDLKGTQNSNGGNSRPETSPPNSNGNSQPGNAGNGLGQSRPTSGTGSSSEKPATSPANTGSNSTTAPGNNSGIGVSKPPSLNGNANGNGNNNNNGGGNNNGTTKPPTSPSGNSGNNSTTKPTTSKPTSGSSIGNGTKPTKPETSPANSGSNSQQGNSGNGLGQLRPTSGTGSNPEKPTTSPANTGSNSTTAPGNNSGIGVSKPPSLNGNANGNNNNNGGGNNNGTTKPPTSSLSNSGNNSTTKPTTSKPTSGSSSGKTETTNPNTPLKGSSSSPSTKTSTTTTPTPVKVNNGTNTNNKGNLGQIRGPH